MPKRPESLGRLINFSANSTNQLCNCVLAEHGLSLQQWVMLSALWREDGMLITELARYSKTNTPAASRIIDRMEKSGFVQRKPDPSDGRTTRVYVTDKSQQISHLLSFFQEINSLLMRDFSAEEQEVLFRLLERVIENADRAVGELKEPPAASSLATKIPTGV